MELSYYPGCSLEGTASEYDDSIRAIDLILNELADAVAIGKTMVSTRPEPTQRPRRVRSKRPGSRAMNQLFAQVSIASFGDATTTKRVSAAALLGCETQPYGKLTCVFEL